MAETGEKPRGNIRTVVVWSSALVILFALYVASFPLACRLHNHGYRMNRFLMWFYAPAESVWDGLLLPRLPWVKSWVER